MSKGSTGLAGVGVGIVVALALLGILTSPGGPGQQTTPFTVTISDPGTTGACTISPAPVPATGSIIKSDNGDYVVWQQQSNKKFEVTFPRGNTASDTGSPFVNPLGTGWNTRFPSRDGSPVSTGEASRTPLEKVLGKHDFLIQTITVTVNGQDQVCYDKDKTPIQGMKVIIDR